MKSTVQGRSYLVLPDDERFPSKIPKGAADRNLDRLERAAERMREAVRRTEEEAPELARLIDFDAPWYAEGLSDRLKCLASDLAGLKEILRTHRDEIPAPEEVMTLEDYGFRPGYFSSRYRSKWEKDLEETEEKTVTEEILLFEEKPMRRIITTLWKNEPHGRSSTSITYRKLPMGKKLSLAAENSRRKFLKGREEC